MRDTSDEAERVQMDAWRRMSPAERVALAFEASDWILAIARAGPCGGQSEFRVAKDPPLASPDAAEARRSE